jgi:hypothetical protein
MSVNEPADQARQRVGTLSSRNTLAGPAATACIAQEEVYA